MNLSLISAVSKGLITIFVSIFCPYMTIFELRITYALRYVIKRYCWLAFLQNLHDIYVIELAKQQTYILQTQYGQWTCLIRVRSSEASYSERHLLLTTWLICHLYLDKVSLVFVATWKPWPPFSFRCPIVDWWIYCGYSKFKTIQL